MVRNFNWFSIRLAALLIFATILVDLEIIALILSLSLLHISSGIKTIIYDYIHVEKLHLIFLILVRICHIELARCLVELII
uniref:Succinate:cytochrome c oxidoreductase subunit 4 n=2 Tax=Pterocladia TaxID=28859 RepID=A0A1D8X7R2_9FLOR|nr:succinate:cytochrome c oxidoreductase subunit 4 [Pterocladia mexicana]YP_009317662.1 succinate:cytochrome c oxidoreductase subunit 4 [Pterocladia robusta]YP_011017051.1 succinate dehydrogenase subunit 4 [Pterocladiella capillacea]AOX49068.1 succinate:cytochrome c oxidoreductase subunit 4 [Pterocladia mexicana]AOX49114.1 succinate:cytochrome c oxidoreductase subunit 4 [Pterocladia robusta]WQB61729.1 succinate dehydrogenase subunit 4 [Pterocladiella capillacea]